jgi:hypothetical protein
MAKLVHAEIEVENEESAGLFKEYAQKLLVDFPDMDILGDPEVQGTICKFDVKMKEGSTHRKDVKTRLQQVQAGVPTFLIKKIKLSK